MRTKIVKKTQITSLQITVLRLEKKIGRAFLKAFVKSTLWDGNKIDKAKNNYATKYKKKGAFQKETSQKTDKMFSFARQNGTTTTKKKKVMFRDFVKDTRAS